MSFLTDTQSNNTNIYPIVTIEPPRAHSVIPPTWTTEFSKCIFLSTNSVSLKHIHANVIGSTTSQEDLIGNVNFKPLLSGMPTINQSIDIKTRKFKVSNVRVNILNNEYQGERFSDLFEDKSLINWLVSIQLVSPSGNHFSTVFDVKEYENENDNSGVAIPESGFESFYDHYIRSDVGGSPFMTQMVYQGRIRDAYQNKESVTLKLEDILGQKGHSSIPTVFTGHSEKIPEKYQGRAVPIVFGEVERSPLVMDYDTDQFIIQADKYSDSEDIGTTFKPQSSSPLSVFKEDVYISIYNQHSDILSSETIHEGDIINYKSDIQYTHEENSPIIVLNIGVGGFNMDDSDEVEGVTVSPLIDNLAYSFINDESIGIYYFKSIDNYTYHTGWSDGLLQDYNGSSIDDWTQIGRTDDTGTTPNGEYYDHREGRLQICHNFKPLPSRVESITSGEFTSSLKEFIEYTLNMKVEYKNATGFSDSSPFYGTWYTSLVARMSGNSLNPGLLSTNLYADANSATDVFTDKTLAVQSLQSGLKSALNLIVYGSGGTDNTALARFTIIEPTRKHHRYYIGDFSESAFYGHVLGRTVDGSVIQNPITIMKYIAETFLDAQVDQASYDIALAEHLGWTFNFTIDEVINTKHLLEDMTKSTKCFIRFNEAGKLAFHTIKSFYLASDYTNAIAIDDAISYIFKLSSLSEIPSKVDVEYSKDHGLDKYLEKTATYEFSAEQLEYYGIEFNSDIAHKQIKSDYITDFQTAIKLLGFNYNWNRNRRLKAELTLGLNHSAITVGSLIKFPKLLGGIKSQGIDYSTLELLNGQWLYPLFMVTSVKLGTKNVKIKAEQIPAIGSMYDSDNWAELILDNNLTLTDEILTEFHIQMPQIAINFFQELSGATITESNGNFSVTVLGATSSTPAMQFQFPTAMATDWNGTLCPWLVEIMKADGTTDVVTSAEIEAAHESTSYLEIEQITQTTLGSGINTLRYRTQGEFPQNDIFKDITVAYSDGEWVNSISATPMNDGKFIMVDYSPSGYNNGLWHVVKKTTNYQYYDRYILAGTGNVYNEFDIDCFLQNGTDAPFLSGPTASTTTDSGYNMTSADIELFGTQIDISVYNSIGDLNPSNPQPDSFANPWTVEFNSAYGIYGRQTAGVVTEKNSSGIYNKLTWRVVILSTTQYNIFEEYWAAGNVTGMVVS